MTLDTLKSANRVIGIKQATKAVKRGNVQTVYVADDADSRVIEPLKVLCQESEIPVGHAETMKMALSTLMEPSRTAFTWSAGWVRTTK